MSQLPHERNKFIEELCEMFYDIFTDYWRLGTMYLNNLLTLPNESEKKSKLFKPNANVELHSSDEFYALVGEILTTFSNIVRAAFISHTLNQATTSSSEQNQLTPAHKNLLLAWPIQHDAKIISQILPHCLRICR